ncbi:MAG: short-chain dehydrogenase [Elusimicrobia bacterium RIFCSPHIGHO2_02_FULL_57_9]|nr:MAG: short-chain dehydrogenase [Elusimicrobia bacterium RIFCSPHIGHO2_02_FULL_57_9]
MSPWTGVSGKQILITGATNGIGLAAIKALAERGAKLAIVARDELRASQALKRIEAAGDKTRVDVLIADLSSQKSVRRLAAEALARYPRLDILINNAGAICADRHLTEDGFERTWVVNHLAPFLLTTLLLDRLKQSAPARIITTSSNAHRRGLIPFEDFNAEKSYSSFTRYGQTKLANILFTSELARRLEGRGVTANCFHPGVVATGLGHDSRWIRMFMTVFKPWLRSPEKGAETLVWLADSPELGNQTGGYFMDKRLKQTSAAARDMEAALRLWEISERQAGQKLS